MPKMIQIRDVPDDVHRTLKMRAAAAGTSLSDYIKRDLEIAASRPTLDDDRRARARAWFDGPAERNDRVDAARVARRIVAVLDASVLVEYLAGAERARAIGARLLADPGALWAPHLVDAEIGHVLRRAVARRDLTSAAAGAVLSDLAVFPLRRAAHVGLLDRAWELRRNVSFHDALYVALAERLGEPLLTLDAPLASASGVRAEVVVVA